MSFNFCWFCVLLHKVHHINHARGERNVTKGEGGVEGELCFRDNGENDVL